MNKSKPGPSIQNLRDGEWYVETRFKDFKSFKSAINRRVEKVQVESISIFRNTDGSGFLELFFPGHIVGECYFESSLVMAKRIRAWRKLGRPRVVVWHEDRHGAYVRQAPKDWRW